MIISVLALVVVLLIGNIVQAGKGLRVWLILGNNWKTEIRISLGAMQYFKRRGRDYE